MEHASAAGYPLAARCFMFGLNAIARTTGASPAVAGVAAGFYVTAASLGGYLLPSPQANAAHWSGPRAGSMGLLVLLTIGVVLWAGTLARGAPTARKALSQPGTVSPGRLGLFLPS